MNQKQIRAAVEAMLFASGDPIGADKLAQAVQLPQLSVEAALEALRERYAREDSGLCLLHLNTRWQLATKTEWADCIRRLLDSRRAVPLGPAAMETLTVIAYNQPVSRAFIEQVRGVDSSSSVSGLLEKGLIEEAGRLDLPGRCTGRKRKRTHHRQKVRGNAWEHSSPRWAQCCCSSSG